MFIKWSVVLCSFGLKSFTLMKYILFQITILLLAGTNANSQILDFSNKKPKIIPVQYDSTYYVLPEYASLEEYDGLKNQRLVDSKGEIWIIAGYNSNSDIGTSELKLLNPVDQSSKIIKDYEYQDYYLEAGFEKFRNMLLGKKAYAIVAKSTLFVAYNDTEILIKPNEEYQITDIKYAKFELDSYAPAIEINSEGYYKLVDYELSYILDNNIGLNGNATNNEIEFTLGNDAFDRKRNATSIDDSEKRTGYNNYDSSGDGIFGRKIVKRNWRELFKGGNQSKSKGKIAVMICVDRAGAVRYTEILFDETTETDSKKLKQAMKAAKGYKVQADPNGPPEQCGKLIFNLDINAFKGIR